MADKEATVYIVDVGKSMGDRSGGRKQVNLDYAMKYIWEKITSTIATGRKTATLGVIALRTDGTANDLAQQDAYKNISVLRPIGQMLLPDLQPLKSKIHVQNSSDGDGLSAIVVAIEMITKYCKKLIYKRSICLVTDGMGSIDDADMLQIGEKLKADAIELVIIGIGFDDVDYGFKEENKDAKKAANEVTLKSLVDSCDGIFGTMQQAIDELGTPRIKLTRPVPSYKGQLTLGDPHGHESAICIDVERYPRVAIRRPLTASNFIQRQDLSAHNESTQSSATILPEATIMQATNMSTRNPLATVHASRTYRVIDPEAPGGQRDVEREHLAKGYEYGRTVVHISESDLNVTKLETLASLDIIGFIPWQKYERYLSMSVSCVMIAQKTNPKAILALSSLIHALFELESYAVARLVTKSDKEPIVLILAPSIEVDFECLLDVQLPYAEDFRQYTFPPLDKILTVSGKKVLEHRNLPTTNLSDAMADYVRDLDLSAAGTTQEGSPGEYGMMQETFSPVLHRIDQAVRWRAVHQSDSIPPPYDILTKYSAPPISVQERSRSSLKRLISAADVKKVPPQKLARRRTRNEVKPLSGLDVGSLLGSKPHKGPISKDNAIPEFRQAIDSADSVDAIREAAKQMSEIIGLQIRDSFADREYESAIEKIKVLREEMIETEEPENFNDFIKRLKSDILSQKLNGDREDMWSLIRKEQLGLISKDISSPSNVTPEDAAAFVNNR